jgi:hypothetical protein
MPMAMAPLKDPLRFRATSLAGAPCPSNLPYAKALSWSRALRVFYATQLVAYLGSDWVLVQVSFSGHHQRSPKVGERS